MLAFEGGGHKKGFHPGPIMQVSYSGYGLQVSINFHIVSVGSHYPFNRHRVLHSLPNLTHFSQLTSIFTPIFPFLVLFTPIFRLFMPQVFALSNKKQKFTQGSWCNHSENMTENVHVCFEVHIGKNQKL